MTDRSKHKKHPPINKNHLKKQMREHIDSRIYSIQKHKAFSPLLELYDVVKVAGEVASAAEATGWVIAEAGPEADPIALAWWIVTGLIIIACLILALQVYFVVIIIKSVISNIPAAGGGLAKAVNPLLQWLEGVLRGMGDTLIEEALAFGATIAAFVHGMASLYGYITFSETQTKIYHSLKPQLAKIQTNNIAISNLWAEIYGGRNSKHVKLYGLKNTLTDTRSSLHRLWVKVDAIKIPQPGTAKIPQWLKTDVATLKTEYAGLHKTTIPNIKAQISELEYDLTHGDLVTQPATLAKLNTVISDVANLHTNTIPNIKAKIAEIETDLSEGGVKVPPAITTKLNKVKTDLDTLYHEVRHKVEPAVTNVENILGQPHGKITTTVLEDIRTIKERLNTQHSEYEDIKTRLKKVETRLDRLDIPGDVDTKKIWNRISHVEHQTSWLVKLAPFLQLLPLTATEIGNLNKLKDKPCQCPSRAGTDNDDMLWAAIAENIAANGM